MPKPRPEVIYAIRHPDGSPIGYEDQFSFLVVDGPDDWSPAADNSHDHRQALDYQLIRLVVDPIATRAYADGHRQPGPGEPASTTPRATRQTTPGPATRSAPEVFYAIRRTDGAGIGFEDTYDYLAVNDTDDDPWDIARQASQDDPSDVTFELIRVTHEPVVRRTYSDGHDIDDIPKDTPPVIEPGPGQTSLLEHASPGVDADA